MGSVCQPTLPALGLFSCHSQRAIFKLNKIKTSDLKEIEVIYSFSWRVKESYKKPKSDT
jgi:hypothetical protein